MPFSHHSHSGQFCGHAENTLEEIVLHAIGMKMEVLSMTEHMPREEEDFYPEEETIHTAATLLKLFDDYYHEAKRLQKAYASQIKIFVGMETDWIRPSSKGFIQNLLDLYQLDLFIGSVHHVDTIPIDYDRATYLKAGGKAGGTEERLFENYFDQQLDMLDALKPPIVGHFDLIRLLSDDPNASLKQWASVWGKILRNLDFIAAYGGIVELNSAALRKGLKEPYPQRDVCVEFIAKGGRLTLSDDSHGVGQIGTNYGRLLQFVDKLPTSSIVFIKMGAPTEDARFPNITTGTVSIANIREHPIFS